MKKLIHLLIILSACNGNSSDTKNSTSGKDGKVLNAHISFDFFNASCILQTPLVVRIVGDDSDYLDYGSGNSILELNTLSYEENLTEEDGMIIYNCKVKFNGGLIGSLGEVNGNLNLQYSVTFESEKNLTERKKFTSKYSAKIISDFLKENRSIKIATL